MEDLDNNFENFIVSLNLDSHTKSELDAFFRNIVSMSEYQDLTYNDVYNEIISFENKVINQTVLVPIQEREVVLAGTSTLRHSLAFWEEELQIESTPYLCTSNSKYNGFRIQQAARKKWWHWVIIGVADALGGIAGGSLGGGGAIVSGAVGASRLANTLIKDELAATVQ